MTLQYKYENKKMYLSTPAPPVILIPAPLCAEEKKKCFLIFLIYISKIKLREKNIFHHTVKCFT